MEIAIQQVLLAKSPDAGADVDVSAYADADDGVILALRMAN